MLIHILRHGVAEVAGAGMKDADRALTAEGIKKLRAILRAARAAEVSPKIILTSPYRRAVQTADLAAEILGTEGDVLKTDALSPASHPEEVWQEIRRHRQEEQLLLAGHEPLLGLVVGYLLGAPDLQVDFKKGAIACIYMDAFGPRPRGVLKWLVTPKLIGTKP